MQILQTLGAFLQNCIQTNTPREIIKCAWNIYYDYKRYRSIACLIISLALSAGGAALFVAEPNICAYFESIVLQGLPFISSTAAKVVVGFIGFWIGGGVGFNSAKYISQQISEQTLGHSNTAYTFNDNDLQRIILKNPQIYQYKTSIKNDLVDLVTAEDLQQLKTILEHVRLQIDNYSKSDPILHDRYKNALLQALQMSNLYPLLELIGANAVSQDIRKNITLQAARYISDIPTQVFQAPHKQTSPKTTDSFRVKIHRSDNESRSRSRSRSPNRSESEEDAIDSFALRNNTVVFSNLKRVTKELNQQKNYPANKSASNKEGKILDDKKKMLLVHDLKRAHQNQHHTQQTHMSLIPDKFKPMLGMKG